MDISSQATSGQKSETKLEFSSFPKNVMCRICRSQEGKMKDMFECTYPENDNISDRILFCTGVKFSQHDGLSKKICMLCLTNLTIAQKFKISCISADEVCRRLINEQITCVIDDPGSVVDEINVKDEMLSEADDDFEDVEMDKDSKLTTESKRFKKKCDYKTRGPKQKKMSKFKRFHCKSCKIYFKTKEESDSHRKVHKDNECFICEICGKSFIHRSSHYSHIRSHLAPKHACPHCDYKTWHKHDLVKHTRIHTGEKIYQCEYCSSSFHTSSNLTDHTRRNHSVVKAYRFSCPRCGKQYYDRTKFDRHMDSHDDIKRHVCEICHSCFTRRCYWKKHLLTQHGIVIPPMRPGRRKVNTLKISPDDLQEGQKDDADATCVPFLRASLLLEKIIREAVKLLSKNTLLNPDVLQDGVKLKELQ